MKRVSSELFDAKRPCILFPTSTKYSSQQVPFQRNDEILVVFALIKVINKLCVIKKELDSRFTLLLK